MTKGGGEGSREKETRDAASPTKIKNDVLATSSNKQSDKALPKNIIFPCRSLFPKPKWNQRNQSPRQGKCYYNLLPE